jgi:hypothetical protein
LIGWIPGPGDGVKKSLRIVNRDPQRFAPVLFDLLRFVLQECGIDTSPEALLNEIFDADKLRQQIGEIEHGVVESSGFEALPEVMQDVVRGTLQTARQNMPALINVVQQRLTHWKKRQRNSSANAVPHGSSKHAPPKAADERIASKGEDRGEHGHANTGTHADLATQTMENITNEAIGISGEHIADYICAYDFHWGTDWQGHDDGSRGRWREGKPSATKLGKLSKGGEPKRPHALYKLSDGPNGQGIDAVWRAGGNNGGKPYAIVEAKATRDEDAPKFLRKPNNQRKPSITSKLGVNAISEPSELLEPLEEDGTDVPKKGGGGKIRGRATGAPPSPKPKVSAPDAAERPRKVGKSVLVQMSHEWIEAALFKAVGALAPEILRKLPGDRKNYSRHLFFSPVYHPSGSPKQHMLAKHAGSGEHTHESHDAFHYDEAEVQIAVNRRKARLRSKYGITASLKEEQ